MEEVPSGDVRLRPEYRGSSRVPRGSFHVAAVGAATVDPGAPSAAEGPWLLVKLPDPE